MKVEVKQSKTQKDTTKYPCVKKSGMTDIIVLFFKAKGGVVLHCPEGSCYRVGRMYPDFIEENFIEFDGEVTLSND